MASNDIDEKTQRQNNKKMMPVLVIGTFLGFLNQTLMNVALPKIMQTFSITAAQGQWLSNGYMLVNGVMVPLTAFLIQRFSTRQLYLSAMSIFAVGTIIGGIAPTYSILILGRMVQAAGAGIIAPLMNVSIMDMYPLNERGKAMGWVGLALNFAPAMGPTLSGYLVQNLSWRYLFFLVAPLIILDIIFAAKVLRNLTESQKLPLNWGGVILSSVGLGSLLLGFSNAGDYGIVSMNVLGYVIIGLAVVALFVYQQVHSKVKLLNFNVFKYHNFNVSVMINIFLMMAQYGGMLLLPLYMQNIRGYNAMISGLALLPGALVTAVMSPISGNLYDRYGAKYMSLVGTIILFLGTIMLSRVSMTTTFFWVALSQAVRQLGLSLVIMPIQTESLNSLPPQIIPDGSAMYTTIRQVAGSFGTAVLIGIMSIIQKHKVAALAVHHSMNFAKENGALQATRSTYLIAAACVVVSCLLTLKFNQRKTV